MTAITAQQNIVKEKNYKYNKNMSVSTWVRQRGVLHYSAEVLFFGHFLITAPGAVLINKKNVKIWVHDGILFFYINLLLLKLN